MRILAGNKIKNIGMQAFKQIIDGYESIVIDIGTGDGEFVYRQAVQNPDIMFIGIDPSIESICDYAVKSCRKPEKGGVKNVIYIVENANDLSDILSCIADKVYVILPWGSLRDGIIKGEQSFLDNIRKVSKKNATLEIYISYCDLYEKQEIENRQLPELTSHYIKITLKDKYKTYGIEIDKVSILSNTDLKKLQTKWAKKLSFGKSREFYHIQCTIKSKGEENE